jgi:hypothetical protein
LKTVRIYSSPHIGSISSENPNKPEQVVPQIGQPGSDAKAPIDGRGSLCDRGDGQESPRQQKNTKTLKHDTSLYGKAHPVLY